VGPWSDRGRDEELLRRQLWREELQRRQIQCRKALSPAPLPELAHPMASLLLPPPVHTPVQPR
jgi:hypothetical protein